MGIKGDPKAPIWGGGGGNRSAVGRLQHPPHLWGGGQQHQTPLNPNIRHSQGGGGGGSSEPPPAWSRALGGEKGTQRHPSGGGATPQPRSAHLFAGVPLQPRCPRSLQPVDGGKEEEGGAQRGQNGDTGGSIGAPFCLPPYLSMSRSCRCSRSLCSRSAASCACSRWFSCCSRATVSLGGGGRGGGQRKWRWEGGRWGSEA